MRVTECSLSVVLFIGVVLFSVNVGFAQDSTEATTKETSSHNKFRVLNHPRNFVSLYEYTHKGKIDTIFSATKFRSRSFDISVNYEIDIRSKVVIEFDRDWIYENQDNLDINVSVRAELSETPLTVPGYSRIGESDRLARFSRQSLGLLVDLLELNKELEELMKNIGYKKEKTKTISGENYTRLSDTTDASSLFDKEYLKFIENPDTQKFQSIVKLSDERNRQLHKFLVSWPVVGHTLELVQKEEFGWFLPILATMTQNHPEIILNSASTISNDYINRLKVIDNDIQKMNADELLVYNEESSAKKIASKLREYYFEQDLVAQSIWASHRYLLQERKNWIYLDESRSTGKELVDEIGEQTLGLLKDTEIILSRTPVKINDSIDIDIINGGGNTDAQQVFPIRIAAKRFGFKNSITESYLFFKRMHVDDVGFGADSLDPEIVRPKPVNFEPYLGISMIWTYYPRSKGLVRVLTPGFGFNVSFPRFGTNISEYSFNPNNFGEVTTSSDTDIGISAGIVVALFDGAIQFSRGYVLSNVDKDHRDYWSIGFSFVKAAKGIKSII